MADIIVLGAGMVGSAMALDLAGKHKVTSADASREALEKIKARNSSIETWALDVTDHSKLRQAVTPFDIVVCAVPGFLGYKTLEGIMAAGKNAVDISFFPENALQLHQEAVQKGVTAFVDCGVAPGMSNLILGYWNEKILVHRFECLVGGLPKNRKWPFEYKAPFSPVDVIEEYTRPARFVENGELVTLPALTDLVEVEFEKPGTLESFNTDGLRSLIETMKHIPNMKEKTLRYPGHVEKIKVLKESGFFKTEHLALKDASISPLEFTSRVLFEEWKLGDEEEELTVMRVDVGGTDAEGNSRNVRYDLYDEYNSDTKTSSMARTTGYTATAAVNMFLDGEFSERGVFPPELVGRHEKCFTYIMDYLAERGVKYTTSG